MFMKSLCLSLVIGFRVGFSLYGQLGIFMNMAIIEVKKM